MTTKPVRRRSYESPRRREQARATQQAVLEAAKKLFLQRGYVATTIAAIATEAGVSPETVYAAFKNKRTIVSRLLDVSLAGDDTPVPILERPWVQEMRDQQDPVRRVQILARNGRLMLERTAAISEVLRGAASADREIAALWERTKERRFAGQRALLGMLIERSPLREGLTASAAADILFAIGSPETYRLLVVDRGWSANRFERWYGDSLAALLFP